MVQPSPNHHTVATIPNATGDVVDALQDLVEDRVALVAARTERAARQYVTAIVAGVSSALFGMFSLVWGSIALYNGLLTGLPAWQASLIVAALFLSLAAMAGLAITRAPRSRKASS